MKFPEDLDHHQRVHVHLGVLHSGVDRICETIASGTNDFANVALLVVEIRSEFRQHTSEYILLDFLFFSKESYSMEYRLSVC